MITNAEIKINQNNNVIQVPVSQATYPETFIIVGPSGTQKLEDYNSFIYTIIPHTP